MSPTGLQYRLRVRDKDGIATPVSSPVAAEINPWLCKPIRGNFLYVTDFAGGNVTVLAIDGATGALTAGVSVRRLG